MTEHAKLLKKALDLLHRAGWIAGQTHTHGRAQRKSGDWDIYAWHQKSEEFWFIEIKVGKDKLSQEQFETGRRATERGANLLIVLDDLEALIQVVEGK